MRHIASIAIFLIAICTLSTRASGQEVYRCGNSYSQKPCADGVVVDVQDARSAAQKAQADANTQRDTATANAMEKARLKEEAQRRATLEKLAAAEQKRAAAKPKKTASAPDETATNAKKSSGRKTASKQKKKEPDFFTASPPGEKTKPPASNKKSK
ncbi:MAG: hypothetical protein V4858_01575 [Pseudomonadota bacterium]